MSQFNSHTLLRQSVNKQIQVKGRISTTIWQHIVGYFEGYPYSAYFDLEDSYQIIIYSKNQIETKDLIEIEGMVVEVKGRPKRATDDENEVYSEHHILVNNFKLVK